MSDGTPTPEMKKELDRMFPESLLRTPEFENYWTAINQAGESFARVILALVPPGFNGARPISLIRSAVLLAADGFLSAAEESTAPAASGPSEPR